MRFHSAPEGFGDGMADMGENGDLHARRDPVRYILEKRAGAGLFPKANINAKHATGTRRMRIAFFSQEDR